MTYDEALAFWYGRINYEQRQPAAGDFKLDRIRALLRRLGNPQDRLRIVHVAGSKGKGSTAAMLAAVLRRAGYRSGLFTSPHLVHVEERIQVDGSPISADELSALLDDVRRVVETDRLEPTFFEVATAVGFLQFARRRVEAAVVEVGLGGRLDSTNVCRPVVSLITSISHDHTKLLGSQLASIAAEKAGIVKPGRPVVSGTTVPEARTVIERVCRELGAPLRQLGVDFRYHYQPGRVTADRTQQARVRVEIAAPPHAWPAFDLALLGEHQAANAAVAVACVEVLRQEGWHVPETAVAEGLANVTWPARLEVVGRRPLLVLDCAHNVASAEALVRTLETSFPPARRWLVFAGSSDKDLAGMFRVLAPHFAHAFLCGYASSPRSVPPERLAGLARQAGLACSAYPSVSAALDAAVRQAAADDLVCVTGSVFLAGEARPLLLAPPR